MTDSDTIETYVRDHAEVRETIAAADPDNGPWPIHGVAVADGDVLHNNKGERILMTAEQLATAQYSQAASKLTKDHPDYEGSPPVDATVGNNSMHYSAEGEAIVYDATTHDEDIAAGVNGETYGVSIHANFEKGPRDPETGAYVAQNIVLHDLSVVSLGDSPSNTAQFGGRSDLAAWANEGGLEAAVAEGAMADGDEADVEGLVRRLANRLGLIEGAADGMAVDADQGDSRAGESGRDADADSMSNKDDNIEFITANSHFTEELLAEMDADAVEQTRDLVDSEDDSTDDEDGGSDTDADGTDDTPTQIGEMSPEELGTALREQGFVTEDDVGDIAEAANEHASDAEKADEVIAASEDYTEDDREELLASPFLDRIHTKATTPGAAPIPGVGGGRDTAEAAVGGSDGEYNADDFSTGVAE
ncbi:hypothetical protein [Halomarina rubra]|uniref:Capsid maturation protease n=1 Tax=Halomarina rubra TaxID=2071873 RepID=A0ABD6AZS9_9EURY|nr:hypothetical protein [Halomarina rubra]